MAEKVQEWVEQGARLKVLIKALFDGQKAIGQLVGHSQAYISQMVTGARPIPIEMLSKIAKKFPEVNCNWIVTGEGTLFFASDNDVNTGPGVLEKMQIELADLRDRVARIELILKNLEGVS